MLARSLCRVVLSVSAAVNADGCSVLLPALWKLNLNQHGMHGYKLWLNLSFQLPFQLEQHYKSTPFIPWQLMTQKTVWYSQVCLAGTMLNGHIHMGINTVDNPCLSHRPLLLLVHSKDITVPCNWKFSANLQHAPTDLMQRRCCSSAHEHGKGVGKEATGATAPFYTISYRRAHIETNYGVPNTHYTVIWQTIWAGVQSLNFKLMQVWTGIWYEGGMVYRGLTVQY